MTRPRKKSRRKRDSNPGSSALEADALQANEAVGSKRNEMSTTNKQQNHLMIFPQNKKRYEWNGKKQIVYYYKTKETQETWKTKACRSNFLTSTNSSHEYYKDNGKDSR